MSTLEILLLIAALVFAGIPGVLVVALLIVLGVIH